jgi:hypothetical protein
MQKNLELRYLVIAVFFLPMLLCTGWGGNVVKTGPVDFTLEPILSNGWACYIQDGGLHIRKIGSEPLKVRGKEASGMIMSPDLKTEGDSIFVVWIERGSGGNKMMFAVSHDKGKTLKKAVELAAHSKTTQVRFMKGAKEGLYILEASSDKEPGISVVFSQDRGETFKRIPLELNGLESLYNPKPAVIGDMLYLFFSGVREGKRHIGVKSFEIPSMRPEGYGMLNETEGVSFIEAFGVRNKPVVIYKTTREGKFVLEGAARGENGWKTFSLKELEGLDVARMDYHVWKDGRILIVFSGEEKGKFKQRIYAAVSEDEGKSWDIRRIDRKESDNTRSWLPRMAVDGDKVVVVWEDSRNIRSRIRMKLSSDRGRIWKERDIPVSDSKYYAFRPRISFVNGTFYVAWHQFIDDERNAADLAMLRLKWADLVKIASQKEKVLSLRKKEALLRERVKAYWKGMIKKDLKTTYEIHDPFYKAKIPFDYYSAHRGPMVYQSYNIEDLKIEGNEATVRIKVKYEVPKIIILGKETFMPPKEITAEDTYLFIDGTWYRKFVDVMSGGSAIDY